MRKFFIFALVLAGAFFCAVPGYAQFTTVTATVQDPNGVPYAGAILNAVLVPGSSGGYRLSGQPYAGRIGPVTLDSAGKFTVNFGDVTLITPGSPQWQITIDSAAATIGLPLGTGPQSFTFTSTGTTISGSSPVSLTASLNALAPKLTNLGTGGTVTSVTGTANQVTVVNPTTTPVVSLPTTVDLVGGVITGSADPNLGSYNFLGSSVIDSFNQVSDPDDVVSFVGSANEVNVGFFLTAVANRPVALQMLRVGTGGGQLNTFVTPSGGSIFDATHVLPTPPYFFVDSPTNDSTTYDTTSAMEISGGAGQNDALSLVGGSAGNATNLNFYLRAISARKAAIQANNSGTNGGGMSIYVKADGGGLTQVNAWNSTLETKFTPTIAAGTQTVSGCSLTSALGGSWTGSFHSGTAGTCTVTITPGGTATNGWQCDATDITTAADTVKQTTPLSTTTCVISGTTASGDIITWKATAF